MTNGEIIELVQRSPETAYVDNAIVSEIATLLGVPGRKQYTQLVDKLAVIETLNLKELNRVAREHYFAQRKAARKLEREAEQKARQEHKATQQLARIERLHERDNEDRFELNNLGVWHLHEDKDGNSLPPTFLCSPLEVIGETFERVGAEIHKGLLLKFGNVIWAMPMDMLVNPRALHGALFTRGLRQIDPKKFTSALISKYIQTRSDLPTVWIVRRSGHFDGAFVLPDGSVIGESKHGNKIVFQMDAEGVADHKFYVAGTLAEWNENVATLARGNSRPSLCICVAFATPLLGIVEAEPSNFHLTGGSSIGKTTSTDCGGSVCGGDPRGSIIGYGCSWNQSPTYLENNAVAHNDLLFVLDELGIAKSEDVGQSAYMLSGGDGKGRGTQSGGAQIVKHWKTNAISTGEVTLKDKINEASRNPSYRGGQAVRWLEIPAAVNGSDSGFERTNGESHKDFAQRLKKNARTYYGTPIRDYLEKLLKNRDATISFVTEIRGRVRNLLHSPNLEGDAEINRAIEHFTMIAAGGELAIHLGTLTAWEPGDAIKVAQIIFKAWLDERGTGKMDAQTAIDYCSLRLQRRGMTASFIDPNSQAAQAENDDTAPEATGRLSETDGYRRLAEGGHEWCIYPQVFKESYCPKGYDWKMLCKALVERGMMPPPRPSEPERYDAKVGFTTGRFFVLTEAALEDKLPPQVINIPLIEGDGLDMILFRFTQALPTPDPELEAAILRNIAKERMEQLEIQAKKHPFDVAKRVVTTKPKK